MKNRSNVKQDIEHIEQLNLLKKEIDTLRLENQALARENYNLRLINRELNKRELIAVGVTPEEKL